MKVETYEICIDEVLGGPSLDLKVDERGGICINMY